MMISNQDIFLSKPQVCCISDIHIGVHQNSSQWHNITLEWAKWLAKDLKDKDINDMVLSGHDIMSVLKSNTYSGLEAQIKFNNWKKV